MRKGSFNRDSGEHESTENNERKNLVKQNLSGRFSPLPRPSIRECAHSTAFSRIQNITNAFDVEDDIDDVFLPVKPEEQLVTHDVKKDVKPKQSGGLWSRMTSAMRLPSRKESISKDSTKNDTKWLLDANSKSIIKKCASIAGSLVRSKSLVDESQLSSLKRKRTYTTDNHSTSTYLAHLNGSDAVSPTSDSFNTSSKRFRIQGRRPIDRMRFNS